MVSQIDTIEQDGSLSALTGFIAPISFFRKFGIALKVVSYILVIFGRLIFANIS
jgi:hypothetical protein